MATRAQQIELLAVGVLYNGAVIATPYAKFLVAGTTTAKTAWDDADKSVAITKKALDAQGRAAVYGDGIYDIRIYSGDPDAGGVLLFTVPTYKVTAVAGNTRTITATTVAGSVDDSLVEADTTSNDITYTLPDAALMAGKIIQIAKSAAANTLTIAAASGQLVNGAASVAYTAQYSTGVFQSNGSSWYVFQTVGDATTLNTFTADTGTTAETIPVRDVSGVLPGDILGSAAKVGVLNVAVVNIGDWNMDSTQTVTIAHGLADHTKVRMISATIRDDNDARYYNLPGPTPTTGPTEDGVGYVDATNILIRRVESGFFDSATFDSTGYNRGWITFWYID